MIESFKKEFEGLWDNIKGVIVRSITIAILLLVSPIIFLERKFGLVTFIRLKSKSYEKQASWDVVKYLTMVRKGKADRAYMFKNHSDMAFKIITYYHYQSWRHNHKLNLRSEW